MVSLYEIYSFTEFNSKVRNDTSGLLNTLMQFKTINNAINFFQIFKIGTPLSDYVKKNPDYVQAWRLIDSPHSSLKKIRDKFDETPKHLT